MALTKAQIVKSIQDQTGFPKNKCTELVEILLEVMKRTLENGEDILISGFGKFSLREKKERKGRNPATGKDMILEKRRVVTFKCSERLKDKINGNA